MGVVMVGRVCEVRVRWEIRWNRDLIRLAPRERSGEIDVIEGLGPQFRLFGRELRDGRVDWPLGYLWLNDSAASLSIFSCKVAGLDIKFLYRVRIWEGLV